MKPKFMPEFWSADHPVQFDGSTKHFKVKTDAEKK